MLEKGPPDWLDLLMLQLYLLPTNYAHLETLMICIKEDMKIY